MRNKIIGAIEDGTFPLNKEQAKKDKVDKEAKEIDLSWMHRSVNELKEVIKEVDKYDISGINTTVDNKNITVRTLKSFLNDIATEKITSKDDVEKNVLGKITGDKKLLQKRIKSYSSKDRKKLSEVIDQAEYVIFGLIPPIKEGEQPDTTDMPELESEKSAAQKREQEGQGLKILTPEQMLSRLIISLAQLKAGNNS